MPELINTIGPEIWLLHTDTCYCNLYFFSCMYYTHTHTHKTL